jgi:transcription antitermination factor NusA-like protein
MNFFERCTGTRSNHCFTYNGTLIFVIDPNLVMRAVGRDGANIKILSLRLRKKIKVIGTPSGVSEIERFVSAIVYPVKFKKITLEGEEATINASQQSKATLIGRNKHRLEELQNILDEYFHIKRLKII